VSHWGEYWSHHFDLKAIENSRDTRRAVGRTKNGIPVAEGTWAKTLDYIVELLQLSKDDDVLELCCGNGELIGNLASRCASASGVDISQQMIIDLKKRHGEAVACEACDVLNYERAALSVDVILIYFSIQHFTEAEAVKLINSSYGWLRPGGRIFVGDIPDAEKLWQYLEKSDHKKDYFRRLLASEPMVGTWFSRGMFSALNVLLDKSDVTVIGQPVWQINSSERFDVLIKKS